MKDFGPKFAFEKIIGINEHCTSNSQDFIMAISRLIECMITTNKYHGVHCEFFRLDFRQPYMDEEFKFPLGSLILDMKWGSKIELDGKK